MTNLMKIRAPWLMLGVVAVIALGLLMPACGRDRERAGVESGQAPQERPEAGAPATDEETGAGGAQVTTIEVPAFLSNPSDYYGRQIAVSGTVRQIVAPGAFLLGSSPNAPQDQSVLVVGSNIGTVIPGSQVRVVGTAKKFDFGEMNTQVGMNWNEAAFKDYDGKPAIQATQVSAGQGPGEQGAGTYRGTTGQEGAGATGTQGSQRTR